MEIVGVLHCNCSSDCLEYSPQLVHGVPMQRSNFISLCGNFVSNTAQPVHLELCRYGFLCCNATSSKQGTYDCSSCCLHGLLFSLSTLGRLDVPWCVVAQEVAIKQVNEFLRESGGVIKIEDVLPLFPDFVKIDAFKEAICQSLEDYNKQIDQLKSEMEDATQIADALR